MDRRIWISIAVLAVFVIAAFLLPLFLPKSGEMFDETAPAGAMIAKAALIGRDGHSASGTVQLVGVDGGHVLRFEDLKQTQGPDVYLYLTREGHAFEKDDVEQGLRILLPQDDRGQFTARGSFNVPLPAGFDPTAYAGVTTWCDRFGVPFSSAALG